MDGQYDWSYYAAQPPPEVSYMSYGSEYGQSIPSEHNQLAADAKPADGKSCSPLGWLLLSCGVVTLIGVAVVMVTSGITEGEDLGTEGDDVGGGGPLSFPGAGSGSSILTTLPHATSDETTENPTTSSSGPTTTTTTTRTPVRELVCTIGAYATQKFSYPPDGLCHYLFYYKLFIGESGHLIPMSEESSWNLFKDYLPNFRTTKGGMAFDMFYLNVDLVRVAAPNINIHAKKSRNIANYGVLDIIAKGPALPALFEKAVKLLRVLREIQNSAEERKFFIGMGVYAFNEAAGLQTLKYTFRKAVEQHDFYTVFLITSISEVPAAEACTVQLTGELHPHSHLYPAIEHFKDVLTDETQYSNTLGIVCISMEMGALLYILKNDFNEQPSKSLLNKDCDEARITAPEAVCSGHQVSDTKDGRFGFVFDTSKRHVFAMEAERSILAKADIKAWMNPTIVTRFSWLVFNVHFDNSLGACAINSNFSRLKRLKTAFGIP